VSLRLTLCLLALLVAPASEAAPLPWLQRQVQATGAKARGLKERRQTLRALRRIDPLLVPAFKAMGSAHAPYSHCRVGAAASIRRRGPLSWIPGLREKVVRGFNSESAGDLQICAERAALAGLPRGLARQNPVRKVAVVGTNKVPIPCGRCLQVISEVGSPETEIISANLRGEHRSFRLRELLPSDFELSTASTLAPHRGLISRAVRAYRQSLHSGINRYRPAFGAAVQDSLGQTHLGMVVKDTASTFTPATQTPLDRVAQLNALDGRTRRVSTVVIAGQGNGGSCLPVPTADERQHLFDMNPDARVVLYNPVQRVGAVLSARELLPHAYQR